MLYDGMIPPVGGISATNLRKYKLLINFSPPPPCIYHKLESRYSTLNAHGSIISYYIITWLPPLTRIYRRCTGYNIPQACSAFSTEPQTLSYEGCNPFSVRRPGWSRTLGNLTTSRLCSGISFIGFPFANASSSKLQPSFGIHSMVVAPYISVDPASPFR